MSPPWKSAPPSSHGHWSDPSNWSDMLADALAVATHAERLKLIADIRRDAAVIEREWCAQGLEKQAREMGEQLYFAAAAIIRSLPERK